MSLIRFDSLPLEETVLQGIKDAGFAHCTPIQSKTLPLTLAGKDVAGQAQTGTGKTAAFLITAFNHLLTRPAPKQANNFVGPRCLIIAPTRELAMQIERDAILLGSNCGLRMVCVYGGVDYEKQKQKILSGLDILIATPGRLIDYYKQKFFSLKSVQVLVIDEADRMFDMGFIQDLRYILRRMTPFDERLSMLFSATLNFRVLELCYEHMNNPEKIAIEPEKFVVEKIQQSLYHVGLHEKFSLLLGLLKREEGKKVIIFCNTKAWAEKLEFKLRHNGYVASQISGDLHQNKRTKVLDQFKNSEIDILIATDVASRGLHVDDITHVINYDLPQDPEDYVHRIGRTARAGAEGTAITLCCENFAAHLEHVEEYLKQKIPVVWPDEELFLAGKPGGEPPRRKPKPRSSSNSSRPSGNSSSRPKGRPGRPSSSSRRPR